MLPRSIIVALMMVHMKIFGKISLKTLGSNNVSFLKLRHKVRFADSLPLGILVMAAMEEQETVSAERVKQPKNVKRLILFSDRRRGTCPPKTHPARLLD